MPSVRVIGQSDVARQVFEGLRSAGVVAQLEAGAPADVAGVALEAGAVDVVCTDSGSDSALALVKRAFPRRPVLAVVDLQHAPDMERALDGALAPDAYVAWPATATDLVAGIRRATDAAARAPLERRVRFLSTLVAAAGGVAAIAARVASSFEPRSAVLRNVASAGAMILAGGGLLALRFGRRGRWSFASIALAAVLGLYAVIVAIRLLQ
jgi:DNA-binding NarL/FixJ family response regulator